MARILFVHGMRHETLAREKLEGLWFPGFRKAVTEARARRGRTEPLPELEFELVYWGDMFAKVDPDAPPLQGLGEDLENRVYDLVRQVILGIDRLTKYDPLARPKSIVARLIDDAVRQTAMYMANAPTAQLEENAEASVYDQIQYRFGQALGRKPDIVIGHSLGSVIAYEGLLQSGAKVPVLLTVGSPIGVPHLIYHRLRPAEEAPRSPPKVEQWTNVSNLTDAMVVPVPRIRDLFRGPVTDVVFRRGKLGLSGLTRNHRLVEYLDAPEVGDVLADALDVVAAKRAP